VRLREKLDWYVPEEQARDAGPGRDGRAADQAAE
jgi:hypothetical protein